MNRDSPALISGDQVTRVGGFSSSRRATTVEQAPDGVLGGIIDFDSSVRIGQWGRFCRIHANPVAQYHMPFNRVLGTLVDTNPQADVTGNQVAGCRLGSPDFVARAGARDFNRGAETRVSIWQRVHSRHVGSDEIPQNLVLA